MGDARVAVSTASLLSPASYDLEVDFHEKTFVCGYKNPGELTNRWHHDSDDQFRRQSLISSLGETSHY